MDAKQVDYSLSLNETNVLKGIAICAMLVHHLFFYRPEFGAGAWHLAVLGKSCISIFLFLSGYGLTVQFSKLLLQIKEKGVVEHSFAIVKFLLKRFTKFYLSYWVVFLVSVSLGVFVFGRSLQMAYGNNADLFFCLIKDSFGLQSFASYNTTWWFNHLILALYLLFPALFWLARRKSIAIGFLILLFLWPREWFVENFFYVFQCWELQLRAFELVFFLGILFAYYSKQISVFLNKFHLKTVLGCSSLCLIIVCIIREFWIVSPAYCFEDMCLFDAGIAILLTFSVISICRISNRQMKPLAFLGKHSMNMYLVHTFICGYFFSDFIYGFKYPILIFSALLGTSLLFSVVLEFAKSKLGFYKLQDAITRRISPRPQE